MVRFRRRGLEEGFTLVELLAVMAIIGLLVGLAIPMINKLRASGNLRACQSNLRQVALALQSYIDNRQKGRWPKYQGVKFLLVLAKEGEIRGEGLDIFVCPGTDDVTWSDPDDARPGSGFEDWDDIDPACISYAGRDNKTYPLDKNKLDEEIVAADDNQFRANHQFLTNFVYADGRVSSVDVADFRDLLGEDAEFVPVGPDSPHEGLSKLLIDY